MKLGVTLPSGGVLEAGERAREAEITDEMVGAYSVERARTS
jgi:hypothetical protein